MQHDPPATEPKQPLFDREIDCPHCGYNLRGLTDPRCPECGQPFDPKELLAPAPARPAGPGLLWAVPRMMAHPARFWSLAPVAGTRGPDWVQFYGLLIVSTFLFCAGYHVPRIVWEQQVRVQPVMRGFPHYGVDAALSGAMVASLTAFLPFAVAVLHGSLCRIPLRLAAVKDTDGAARAIVAYSWIWTLLASPALAGLLFGVKHSEMIFGVGPWVRWVGPIGLAVLAAAAVVWFRTLYEAGRSYAAGCPRCGVWCAMLNPLWYIMIWMVLAA